ncbi:oxidoreductase, Gfo/Idh/MocA family [Streptococcus sp. DD10]|uniref:Gfo/Idh/MocA family protein n=1 Tax=Streptococcus sp. DD10 TaxID=1777878 RepID=UPI00079774C1|nr:Gfo/Idh/MocA family oxidoreductase [Streptococcus sp. DD10]KXT77069.1 oxidoreductase, Gfo/Idh/MocA family [Streptococcus sp. DD10]
MFKLGIIGTGAISHDFIHAASLSQEYQLAAVYSRRLETAEQFVKNYENIALFDDLTSFLQSDLDVVYIASPNSLHYLQAKLVLEAGKNAIIEKPAVIHPAQWQKLGELAQKQQVYVFEAARNYHEYSFEKIATFLKDKTILGAQFTFAKYSSKMPDLLAGKIPNVFSHHFAGGALMDLGIYPIYAAVRLFGKPNTAFYKSQQLDNTIDLNGTGQLIYPSFQVTISTGKNLTSNLVAEIYTEDGTLTLNGIEFIKSAVFQNHKGETVKLPLKRAPHQMLEEAVAFATIMKGENDHYPTLLTDTLSVHETIFTMRLDAGIHFEEEYHASLT